MTAPEQFSESLALPPARNQVEGRIRPTASCALGPPAARGAPETLWQLAGAVWAPGLRPVLGWIGMGRSPPSPGNVTNYRPLKSHSYVGPRDSLGGPFPVRGELVCWGPSFQV